MLEQLLTCKPEALLRYTEAAFSQLENEKDAEILICTIFRRVPELTESQEKELHKLGRKIRKGFGMKPVKMDLGDTYEPSFKI